MGGSRPGAARLDAWLCREVLQQQAPLAEGGPAGGGAAAAGCAGEALEQELQEALLRAQGDALPPGAALGAPAPSAGAAPPPGRCAELTVLVQGRPHPLDQALDSDELQEPERRKRSDASWTWRARRRGGLAKSGGGRRRRRGGRLRRAALRRRRACRPPRGGTENGGGVGRTSAPLA
ncbi:unnamed protein product [Prorocentrum cordatum]|uniref:Uncharacterized protein n=1 Tax=Prorocentrum cordatum TaxID=2364126 RepID=A0ABN9UB19_9DINO|nr:unnamed protein product [Polarella glacialis]